MKKVLSMVLTIVMLISIFSTVLNLGMVSAESLTSTPTVSSDVVDISRSLIQTPTPTPTQNSWFTINIGSAEGRAGDVVKVPISIVDVPSRGMNNLNCIISFDETKLKYMPNESKAFVSGMMFGGDGTLGEASLVFDKINPDSDILIKEDGEIAYITFKILGPYSEATPIRLVSEFYILNHNDNRYNESVYSLISLGSVNIIGSELPTPTTIPTPTPTPTPTSTPEMQINVGEVKGKTGDLVTVPVSFKSIPENGIATALMTVKYDPALLKCVSMEAGNIVSNPEISFSKSNPAEGIIKLLYLADFEKSAYITKGGVFANITFKVLGSYNKSTPVTIFEPEAGNIYLIEVPVRTVSGFVDISGTEPIPGFQVEIASTKGYIGDLITIPVSFTNVPDKRIEAFDMILEYDPSGLEYVSYKAGSNVPSSDSNFGVLKETEGKLKLIYLNYLQVHDNEIRSDGVVVNLIFRVISTGESTVSASKAKFYDTTFNEVNALLVPGQISLSEPPLITEKIGVYYNFTQFYDQTGVFQIEFSKVPSNLISSVSMTVDYDPTELEYVDAFRVLPSKDAALEITSDLTIQKISEKSFKIIYKALDENNLINEGLFAFLSCNSVALDTQDYSIQIKDVTFTDKYGRTVGAEIFSVPVTEVSIGTVGALEGSTVVVPVKLESVPQCGVSCCELRIDYDPKVLEYANYEAGSIVPNPAMCRIDSSQLSDKLILSVDVHNESIKTKGDLVYLTFKVKDASGFSPIKFEYPLQVMTASSIITHDVSKVLSTNGGVKISAEEQLEYTVSGCVDSDLVNTNLSKFSFNEGFKVELAETAFSALTDSNGYFEIKNVPVGKYTVAITKANHLSRYIENISVDKDKVLSTASSPITLWYGDIDENGKHDGAINLEDIMQICKVFNTVSGDCKYKENLDLNKDGAINLEDLMIIAKNFNKCSSDYQ